MPSVPRYSQPQVDQRPLPAIRTSPDAPIEAFGGGRGLDRVAGAARDLAQTGMDIYESEKRKADEIAVRDADIASAELSSQLELGVRGLQGKDAAAAPDYVDKEWTAGLDNIKAGLKNDTQHQAAERILQMRRIQLNETAQLHMANEFKKYDAEQFDNAIKIYRANGSMKYNRPGAISGSIIQQESEIDRFADRNKLPDEWKARQKAVAKSATYRDVLERMLVDGKDNQAKAYEKSINKFILPDDVSILDNVRKENAIRKADALEQYERNIYLGLVDSKDDIPKKLTFLDGELRSDRMKLSTYKKMKEYVLDINNDQTIPFEEKLSKYLSVVNKLDALKGVIVNKKTKEIKSVAKGNTMEQLRPVMDEIIENSRYFTKDQQRNLMKVVQDNYDNPSKNYFRSLVDYFKKIPQVKPQTQMDILDRGLKTLDKNVTPQQAAVKIQELKEEAVTLANKNKSIFVIGMVKKGADGHLYEVVGHAENGNPQWKRKK